GFVVDRCVGVGLVCYFSATPRDGANRRVKPHPPMIATKRERISSVDTAWLRMDRPSNLMMICGVLIFRERISLKRLRATISDRFLRFERFTQRAVQTGAAAYWETDPDFDIA